jgi:hypothetical protein
MSIIIVIIIIIFIISYQDISKVDNEMSKYEEQLNACLKYKKFLDELTPKEWLESSNKRKLSRSPKLSCPALSCPLVSSLVLSSLFSAFLLSSLLFSLLFFSPLYYPSLFFSILSSPLFSPPLLPAPLFSLPSPPPSPSRRQEKLKTAKQRDSSLTIEDISEDEDAADM